VRIFFENILSFKTVAGVNIHHTSKDEYTVYCCLLEKKKGALHSNLFERLEQTNLDRLSEIIPKSTPVILSFTGTGVLNKDFPEDLRDENVRRYFPENNHDDIYAFETEFQSYVGLSICRREYIDGIAEHEVFKNLPVVAVHLGPYLVSILWSLNLADIQQIPFNQGVLELIENNRFRLLADNKDDIKKITLGEEHIEAEYILAYTAALNVHLGMSFGSFIEDTPKNIQTDYSFKKLISRTKFAVLAILLGILSVNFMVFENFRSKNTSIEEQLKLNNGTLIQRDSLRSVLKAKEDFLRHVGNNRTYFSLMLDEIATTVPKGVKLNELKINPQVDKARKEEPLEFIRKIEIGGFSKNTLILNQWEHKLADITWVKEAEVISFAQNRDMNTGEFLVELMLK
jgi:Tfp pilus assembly protein PilN